MDHLISQYGLWAGLLVFLVWTTLPTAVAVIKGLGQGKAAVVTAQANVLNADAQGKLAESETQIGMTRMAFEMLQEQRANNARNDALNQSITQLKVDLATVNAEKKGQADSVTQLLTQIGLIEENRQLEKKQNERLEAEVNTLRGEMEGALNKLIAAEARETENRQLRETNATLEQENSEYRKRIGELETIVAQLMERIQQLEADKAKTEAAPAPVGQPELTI